MIKKQYRLTSKEVNYILKKRQVFATSDFLFFRIPQYTNRPYNQFALQLSAKTHKRAVRRNKMRRLFYDIIEKNNLISKKNEKTQWYIKTIALPHKTKIEEIHSILDEKNREFLAKRLQNNLSRF